MLVPGDEEDSAVAVTAGPAATATATAELAAAEHALKSTMGSADARSSACSTTSSRSSSSAGSNATMRVPWTQCAASKSGVFLLTFFSYVLFHACRKSFSAIKGEMSAEQWMHSALYPDDQQGEMYGLLDTLFMGFYAVGLYIRYQPTGPCDCHASLLC